MVNHYEDGGKPFFESPSIKILTEEGKTNLVEILEEVLKLIVPSPEEQNCVLKTAEELVKKLESTINRLSIKAKVALEGSVRKGTWLAGDVDFDIFILFKPDDVPENYKEFFRKAIIEVAKTADLPYETRYAEHPYVRVKYKGFYADIVPAFETKPDEIISAVDRTPYHTEYVVQHITPALANDIRLLKSYFKGIGVYGAEVKVGGFSGYVCELLVIHYGSFIRAIKAIAEKHKFFIDPTKTWKLKEAKKRFNNHFFILIDPVDPKRNAAAALRQETFDKAKLFSKIFMDTPSTEYFHIPRRKTIQKEPTINEMKQIISNRKIRVISLRKADVPPDTYWGQTLRITNSIKKYFSKDKDFQLLTADPIESKDKIYILLEFRTDNPPKIQKVYGPPVTAQMKNIKAFITTHKQDIISGPWIENGRLVALISKTRDLDQELEKYLKQIRLTPSFIDFEVTSLDEHFLGSVDPNTKLAILLVLTKPEIRKKLESKQTRRDVG